MRMAWLCSGLICRKKARNRALSKGPLCDEGYTKPILVYTSRVVCHGAEEAVASCAILISSPSYKGPSASGNCAIIRVSILKCGAATRCCCIVHMTCYAGRIGMLPSHQPPTRPQVRLPKKSYTPTSTDICGLSFSCSLLLSLGLSRSVSFFARAREYFSACWTYSLSH